MKSMNLKTNLFVILIFSVSFVFGQSKLADGNVSTNLDNQIEHRHTLGASFFMLGNFLTDSPDYYLLTYGNRLTKKDRIFIEFNTWRYSEPLGTYGNSVEFYPGFVRAYGLGFGYQRFHWKGMFTTIQATSFMKQYHDSNDIGMQKGFQLYLQFIAGYRFEFFNKRFYVEPAYALKYWPIDTNYPTEFSLIEKGKPKYIFEPSLNFGFKL